ncbi:suppressor of fused homolog [Hyposmocoma kahamanoa]|uniref:suppressor of fused homolog n=1 Tax=Hyposmocoma kahamanoa TaxID=1477025 RepID=UPI000E6D9EAD|nr:suppressor of fused homolog [Hyposmocoma kahamanoa]
MGASDKGSWRGVEDDSIEHLEGVHLFLNAEGASLLPLAIDGRILHDRHFTWRAGQRAVTMLSPKVGGSFADVTRPYVSKGFWLQMVIPKDLAQDMSKQVSQLSKLAETDSESGSESETEEQCVVPLTLTWPRHRLKISIVHDRELL